tara:strand:- start:383 stop:634 length:252 start_codon:yes stop_codon:yes gene_type:complete
MIFSPHSGVEIVLSRSRIAYTLPSSARFRLALQRKYLLKETQRSFCTLTALKKCSVGHVLNIRSRSARILVLDRSDLFARWLR